MCPIWNTLSVRNMEHVHDTTTNDNDTELYLFCDDTYKRDNNNESGFNIFAIFIGITDASDASFTCSIHRKRGPLI